MIESVMEGDEGMDKQYKLFLFSKGREDRFRETDNTQKFLEI